MAFGNPYGDPWNIDIVEKWVENLSDAGIQIISLSDTIGVSTPENISYLFNGLIPKYPAIQFGAHLHTHPGKWEEKIKAVIDSGCNRIDTAMRGYGGCPMAKDDLVGNMPTEKVITYLSHNHLVNHINLDAFQKSYELSAKVFFALELQLIFLTSNPPKLPELINSNTLFP